MHMTTQSNGHHTHISSEHRWTDLRLREVWQYRDLIFLLTKRSFTLTYKQTILGPLWIFLTPLFSSIIYAFVFGYVAGMSTEGVPQLLFYLCGNTIWTFFSNAVTKNASTFTTNAGLFGKVYFPRLTLPASSVLSSMIHLCIQMLLVGVLLVWYMAKGAVQPNWLCWLYLPLVIFQLGLLGLGCGILLSSLTTKYRDLSILVTFGVQLWMYASPVVYPLSQLGDGLLKRLIMLNPVTPPIELFRYAVLGKGTISPLHIVFSVVVTIIIAILGIMAFNRVERNFMDTV